MMLLSVQNYLADGNGFLKVINNFWTRFCVHLTKQHFTNAKTSPSIKSQFRKSCGERGILSIWVYRTRGIQHVSQNYVRRSAHSLIFSASSSHQQTIMKFSLTCAVFASTVGSATGQTIFEAIAEDGNFASLLDAMNATGAISEIEGLGEPVSK
eukprot:scaffold4271_cov96-Cylindrotheca_fusiformis.AAC.5